MRNSFRLMRNLILEDSNVLGIGAVAFNIRARKNGITNLETGYFLANGVNHA